MRACARETHTKMPTRQPTAREALSFSIITQGLDRCQARPQLAQEGRLKTNRQQSPPPHRLQSKSKLNCA